MNVEKVFALNHHIAVEDGGDCRVVQREEGPLWPAGYYRVREDALGTITQRRDVQADCLAERMSEGDLEAAAWKPDSAHCWCEVCKGWRQLRATVD
jgi:hypothetical protein